MKRIRKDRKVEEVTQEKYIKSEEVEEEKKINQNMKQKAITEEAIKQFRLQDDDRWPILCTLLITMLCK